MVLRCEGAFVARLGEPQSRGRRVLARLPHARLGMRLRLRLGPPPRSRRRASHCELRGEASLRRGAPIDLRRPIGQGRLRQWGDARGRRVDPSRLLNETSAGTARRFFAANRDGSRGRRRRGNRGDVCGVPGDGRAGGVAAHVLPLRRLIPAGLRVHSCAGAAAAEAAVPPRPATRISATRCAIALTPARDTSMSAAAGGRCCCGGGAADADAVTARQPADADRPREVTLLLRDDGREANARAAPGGCRRDCCAARTHSARSRGLSRSSASTRRGSSRVADASARGTDAGVGARSTARGVVNGGGYAAGAARRGFRYASGGGGGGA